MTGIAEPLDVASALVRLAHLVQRVFADVARAHDLTPQQAQLLCRLAEGPQRMRDLSLELRLEKSSLTGLVDRVERRGLVAREQVEHDRRACRVGLSGPGGELARTVHGQIVARLEALTADLPPAATAALAASVEQVLAAGAPAPVR